MCLEELRRIRLVMQKHYPEMIRNGKISPYTRDHRFAVSDKLITMLLQAKANKKKISQNNFNQLLNQLP